MTSITVIALATLAPTLAATFVAAPSPRAQVPIREPDEDDDDHGDDDEEDDEDDEEEEDDEPLQLSASTRSFHRWRLR